MKFYFWTTKSNVFLVLMTLMVLFITSAFWYGIPLFSLPAFFYEMNIPGFVQFILVCLSVGFCFSLFCIPLHLTYSKEYSIINRGKKTLNIFLRTQCILIGFIACVFAVFYFIVLYVAF